MALTSKNSNLHTAKKVKNDEFYTRYEDIEAEVMKYRKYFRDKVVYLLCDDPIDVPISFFQGKYNPNQFEIVGEIKHGSDGNGDFRKPFVNGVEKFTRLVIRRKKNLLGPRVSKRLAG